MYTCNYNALESALIRKMHIKFKGAIEVVDIKARHKSINTVEPPCPMPRKTPPLEG